MNVHHSQIQKIMLHEYEQSNNIVETIKNICCLKGDCAIDHCKVTRWFKKFCLEYKNLENLTSSDRLTTMDSKNILLAIAANPASWNLESIKWFWHLTAHYSSSPSQHLLNCVSCSKKIAKLLTHSSILHENC